jgi:hypothetical protein
MAQSWPPLSLASDPVAILNECEYMELLPERGAGKQFIQVVELATFLYTGEYVHARHVWRRWKDNNPPSLLADWWKLGAAMMKNDSKTLWEALTHIQANHPAPLSSYAQEVAVAYRTRILRDFPATQPYLTLLNFSSQEALQLFCEQNIQTSPKSAENVTLNSGLNGTTGLTQVVAFLDSAASASAKA